MGFLKLLAAAAMAIVLLAVVIGLILLFAWSKGLFFLLAMFFMLTWIIYTVMFEDW